MPTKNFIDIFGHIPHRKKMSPEERKELFDTIRYILKRSKQEDARLKDADAP